MWTTPKTWAVGDFLTASDMNTYVRDNTATLNPTPSSSPPGSPADGDRWIYDSGGEYFWQFVYDSSEATNKWKFVGGPPLTVSSDTDLSTTGTTTFTTPTLTVPLSGEYTLMWQSHGYQNPNVGTQTVIQIFPWKNGTTEVGRRSVGSFVSDVTGFQKRSATLELGYPISLAASDTLQLRGTPTNWDYLSEYRSITVIPKRVIA